MINSGVNVCVWVSTLVCPHSRVLVWLHGLHSYRVWAPKELNIYSLWQWKDTTYCIFKLSHLILEHLNDHLNLICTVYKIQAYYFFLLEIHKARHTHIVKATFQVEQDEMYIFLKWKFSRAQRHLVSTSGNL